MTPNSPETDLRPERRHRMLTDRSRRISVFPSGRESPLHAPRGQVRFPAPKQICAKNNATGRSGTGCAADLFSLPAESRLYTHPEGRSAPLPTNRSAQRTTPQDAQGQVAPRICFRLRPRVTTTRTQRTDSFHRPQTDLHQEHHHGILSGRPLCRSIFAYDPKSRDRFCECTGQGGSRDDD